MIYSYINVISTSNDALPVDFLINSDHFNCGIGDYCGGVFSSIDCSHRLDARAVFVVVLLS